MSHYFIEDTTLAKDPKIVDFIVKNNRIMVVSDKGTFSKYRVDLGTRIFIDTIIALPLKGDVLDLGSGNGIIGISVKKVFSNDVRVTFSDVNPYCVELTKKSLILNDLEGNYVATFAKRKIAMRAGETDIAETVNPSQFEKIAKLISSELKHIGNLDVDCFITDDGDLYVLEMNCRFGGQYPFTHNSGVDEPQQIINWLEGKDTDMSLLVQRDGIKSCKELVPVIIK